MIACELHVAEFFTQREYHDALCERAIKTCAGCCFHRKQQPADNNNNSLLPADNR